METPLIPSRSEMLKDAQLIQLSDRLIICNRALFLAVEEICAFRDKQWKKALVDFADNHEKIEQMAVKHEAFGFGQVDAKGYTTHGFDPDGLRNFVKELLKVADRLD